MTPFEIGLTSFYISGAVILSGAIVVGLHALFSAVYAAIEWYEHKRLYGRFMNPEYWHLKEVKQAPNGDYLQLVYTNSATRENITLGLEKAMLKEQL